MEIHNREDCCQERINGVKVGILLSFCLAMSYARIKRKPAQHMEMRELYLMQKNRKKSDENKLK